MLLTMLIFIYILMMFIQASGGANDEDIKKLSIQQAINQLLTWAASFYLLTHSFV